MTMPAQPGTGQQRGIPGVHGFSPVEPGEHARDIEALMRRFARRMKHLYLRREARFHHGRRLDLQGTIRRSVASGGTPLRLAWKERRRVRPRLLLLLDVSRSMSLYSFFTCASARALCAELADVHCFIFHTRITGVGEALRDPDPCDRRNGCTCSRKGGRGHAHRRMPARLQTATTGAPGACTHRRDHRQRRL